jgi:hypothetical protein
MTIEISIALFAIVWSYGMGIYVGFILGRRGRR